MVLVFAETTIDSACMLMFVILLIGLYMVLIELRIRIYIIVDIRFLRACLLDGKSLHFLEKYIFRFLSR